VSWSFRLHEPHGHTSPDELAAAAHSACFAMSLARKLGQRNLVPQRLTVMDIITLEVTNDVPTIVSSALRVRAHIPGLDNATFQSVVNEAANLCPISRLFTGAKITIDAALE
jgi:osmotically inducible protein OsmC